MWANLRGRYTRFRAQPGLHRLLTLWPPFCHSARYPLMKRPKIQIKGEPGPGCRRGLAQSQGEGIGCPCTFERSTATPDEHRDRPSGFHWGMPYFPFPYDPGRSADPGTRANEPFHRTTDIRLGGCGFRAPLPKLPGAQRCAPRPHLQERTTQCVKHFAIQASL